VVNQALEKRERITMEVKGRSEIRSEIGKITGIVTSFFVVLINLV
jgi:hypothetical protein